LPPRLEQHPQERKVGVTRRELHRLPRRDRDGSVRMESRYLVTIRLRVRGHVDKVVPWAKSCRGCMSSLSEGRGELLGRGSLLAVLLHELCHLRHMNHGIHFMGLLQEIFVFATQTGLFEPKLMENEIPSRWAWENAIFCTGGAANRASLLALHGDSKSPADDQA
ncbi:unnamed protein product, partial [Prorocentrum cordatum]